MFAILTMDINGKPVILAYNSLGKATKVDGAISSLPSGETDVVFEIVHGVSFQEEGLLLWRGGPLYIDSSAIDWARPWLNAVPGAEELDGD